MTTPESNARDLPGLETCGGWTIVQVPIALALKETIEDPSIKDENERIRLFGQRDHVRMYAADDYQKRL